jgi:predicted Zn-dependent protease
VGRTTERTPARLTFVIVAGCVLLSLLGWGGYELYGALASRHSARRAAAYLSGGELKDAALSAHRALQIDQNNVDAMRVLATIAERTNDRNALSWRERIVRLKPDSVIDALAMAECALRFKNIATAEKILQQLPPEAQRTAEFQATAARLADARHQQAEAEIHWNAAIKLAPQKRAYQLELGRALMGSSNEVKRSTGKAMLEKLRGDKEQRAIATRALILDGLAHRANGRQLLAMSQELKNYPEATFNDRLLFLDLLHQLGEPQFTSYLSELEKDVVSSPANLAAMFSWMNANRMSLLAIDFAHTLPADMTRKWPIPPMIAKSYEKMRDWPDLAKFLQSQDWGEFDSLRHAYLSLALREEGKPVRADSEWALAQKRASDRVELLTLLSRLVSDWGWKKEDTDLLWMLTKHPETRLDAFEALYHQYTDEGNTPGLYRVLTQLVKLLPEDRRLQNNFAQLCLLLDIDVDRAQELARDLYAKEPNNPAYVSTYAFALYTIGDSKGALEIMNPIGQSQWREPSLAAYYGIVLAAAGHNEKAKEFLELAASGKLLPEERALIAKAEESLRR